MKLELLFLTAVLLVIIFSVISWAHGKNRTYKLKSGEEKQHNENSSIEFETEESRIKDAHNRLSELKNGLEELKSNRLKIQLKLDYQEMLEEYEQLSKSHMRNIKETVQIMKVSNIPEDIEKCHYSILNSLNWFLGQENLYPEAPWLMASNVQKFIDLAKTDYNARLMNLAANEISKYKLKVIELATNEAKHGLTYSTLSYLEGLRVVVDATATNNKECFKYINEAQYEVEDFYSEQ